MDDWTFILFNSESLCCFSRLCASGFGHSSLHLGSALSASHSGACVQTEGERPLEQTYVLLICTHTHRFTSMSMLWVRYKSLTLGSTLCFFSDSYFLSVRRINCISHSRKRICSVPLCFNSFTIAHFPFPLSQVHKSW